MYEQDVASVDGSITKGIRRTLGALVLMTASVSSFAANGFITTNEAALDLIFSQSSFALTPIDIRFNNWQTVAAPTLLAIDAGEFNGPAPSLSFLAGSLPINTVAMFYVDKINVCGVPGPSIVGCGSQPGRLIALDSAYAAGSRGAALLAHELGHNLGLPHLDVSNNLMNPQVDGDSVLSIDQVSDIFSAPFNALIQTDGGGQRFISITPFAVVASIPEPHTWLMMGVGLLGLGWARRKRAWSGG